jgi:small ligand-binding sensory domain FIST
MGVRIGCGLSTDPDPRSGAIEAAQRARATLEGQRCDVVLVFASGHHLASPESTLEGVDEALAPPLLVGCGAGGVLGAGREVEEGTAVAVWAAALGGGHAEVFHAEAVEGPDGPAVIGMPGGDPGAVVLLPDPYSFPADAVVAELAGIPVLGGVSSARTLDGGAALFCGDEVKSEGAVGVAFEGVDVHAAVSQGARPLGPEMTITAAESHMIHELAGRPALSALRDAVAGLPESERGLVAEGLLLGLVVDAGKPEFERGDFLVRALLGADPDTGAIAVGAHVEAGQVVRLHVRDAGTADSDLREVLTRERLTMGGRAPAGALMFTCNGRGRAMFGEPDHDALAADAALAGAPVAGFFAAGEIGPVGGRAHLHGFTATLAVFGP